MTMTMAKVSNLGGRIRHARETKGLSKSELAALIGVTEGAVRFLEDGRSKDMAGTHVFPMADALGVSARWLLTGRESGELEAPTCACLRTDTVAKLASAIANADERRLNAVMVLLQP